MSEIPDPAPLDLSALTPESLPADSPEFGIPDHTASAEPKRKITDIFKPAGDRANDAPKRERASTPKRKTVPKRKGQFVEPLTQMYAMVGAVAMPFDPVCANAVIQSAESCAKSLDDLAYQNDAVRRALYSLTQTSAMGAVIIAHAPIAMAVMMHHSPTAQRMLGEMGQQFAANVEDELKATGDE